MTNHMRVRSSAKFSRGAISRFGPTFRRRMNGLSDLAAVETPSPQIFLRVGWSLTR